MTSGAFRQSAIGAVCMLMSSYQPSLAQIVPQPVFDFEFVVWGEEPSEIQNLFDFTWLKDYSKESYKNLGSGREDVTLYSTKTVEFGVDVYLRFEFRNADSGLVCVTLVAGGLPPLYTVPDEFVDHVWDSNNERFGEPSGGKWIPLIGESKEWVVGDVFIKMVRANLPFSGITVKYVLQEEERTDDPPDPDGGP